MKKFSAVFLAVLLLFTLAACGGNPSQEETKGSDPAPEADVVKIGVFEPQSGQNGPGGKQEILGMQYANKVTPTVEIGGKTYKVELVYADNESSTDKAPTAAGALVAEKVSVVLGSYGSSVSIAAADSFKNAGIPAIGVTCTNPQVTQGNSHYFRICFIDPFQGTVLANYAYKELGIKKAYTLAELGNDYDQGLAYYFKQAFEKLGGEVVAENFPADTADFTTYITNAKNAGAGVVFAPTSLSYAQLIIEQSNAQGLNVPLLAGDTWDSNVILSAAEGSNAKIYVTTFYQEGGNAEFDSGIKAWINSDSVAKKNNNGNDKIAAITAMGYDAYYVALEALKKAGSIDPNEVYKVLPAVKYTGVTGAVEFDDIGDAKRDAAFVKTANTQTGDWDFIAQQGV